MDEENFGGLKKFFFVSTNHPLEKKILTKRVKRIEIRIENSLYIPTLPYFLLLQRPILLTKMEFYWLKYLMAQNYWKMSSSLKRNRKMDPKMALGARVDFGRENGKRVGLILD